MPTIGLDYTSAIHQSAGIGRYTAELVKALAKLSQDGQSPAYRLFVAGAGRHFCQSLPGQNFSWRPTRLSERWLARLWYRLRLPLGIELWTGRLDLFHGPDFFLPPVKAGTRTIVTIHDLSFERDPTMVMPGMLPHLTTWVPRSVERADHVIAVSAATRQDLLELYHTPPEKISVLYHGVGEAFKPVRETTRLQALRQKYGLGLAPFVLSLGTLQPRKNYQRLIQAFAQVPPPYRLVIAGGKGWHYQAILAEVERQQLTERVRFLGFVAEADLPALYSAASLFVYPSLYEGFGLPLLEAMACGTPVVASTQSALPEVVGPAGLLVNPYQVEALAQAMTGLLADPARQDQLAAAGRDQAKKFSWAATARQLLALYHTVLKQGQG
jgi:glycosyltransferase involved in cell wall biosynthesis